MAFGDKELQSVRFEQAGTFCDRFFEPFRSARAIERNVIVLNNGLVEILE